MLENSNHNSTIATNETLGAASSGNGNYRNSQAGSEQQESLHSVSHTQSTTAIHTLSDELPTSGLQPKNKNNTTISHSTTEPSSSVAEQQLAPSLAAQQLARGTLQIFQPPLLTVKGALKELIGKQNKIYIDLSAEKYKLDNADIASLQEMMNNVKIYREKLIRIKKQMKTIYQRTQALKKRAANIQTCKQKELQRKLLKQQQEESLIGKQQQKQQ